MTTSEVFEAGTPVPREWFKRLDNVETVTFMHPCIVETTDERRTIRKVHPALDIPMLYFSHFEGSDGIMNVAWDRETVVYL
jgi:hypothetical protein